MLKKIHNIWCSFSKDGLCLPMAHDAENSRPSLTLLVYYLSSVIVLASLIYYHINPTIGLLGANVNAIAIWTIAFVQYRIRKVDKFKFDLDDQSFEIDANSEKEEKE